ncbi:hypothetical protein XM38_029240 [Halomicronema hongdechloris C2206]|uniref:Peptidase S54 rhomboid domain-containing protein n=1 Tax=Halomicronema hongdechloris C2206 TaxID=1641165 RepID=A0A1Z3HNX1_9CYAN|nr:rhomboid family intramembrane serine protease [Halomicronema hongdechloris]ASC71970.1 hypothetical protein XM38_029240 [Halomicronema hongdechloris C2206]
MTNPNDDGTLWSELQAQVLILGGLVIVIWLVHGVDWLLPRDLRAYGIHPRTWMGLRGILLAPFLHGSWTHLIANTIPLVTLAWLIMLRQIRDFWLVSLVVMLVGGLGIWLVGATGSVHIGASTLIFGYFGFLMMRSYFERSLVAIAMAILVFFLYGSIIWGILPTQTGVSWEGHLFGLIGGIIAARWLSRR